MNIIGCHVSKLLTDNGLFRAWKRETSPFSFKGWRGRRDNFFPREEVEKILASFFSRERDRLFTLFYSSDYKHTFIGKSPLSGRTYYLKYYKMSEAPRKIRSRNILRRTLAKKAMSLHYVLKEKGVSSVQALFYAKRERLWVPREAVFASLAAEENTTLTELLPLLPGDGSASDLVKALGRYLGSLHRHGVLYGEISSNLIPVKKAGAWSFILCDLDEMRSVGKVAEKDREKYLARLRRNLGTLGGHFLEEFETEFKESLRNGKDSRP